MSGQGRIPGGEVVCLIGWGAIARRVGQILAARQSPVVIRAVAVRDKARTRVDLPATAQLITDPAAFAATGATLAIEAAGRESVLPWGRAVLAAGGDYIVTSTSAFVDDEILPELLMLAQKQACRVIIPPGALGGLDALVAASYLNLRSVRHKIIKPVRAWFGTKAEILCNLPALTKPFAFFEASARETADEFPQNANAAVMSALAGVGLDQTRVTLVADPFGTLNIHEIEAEGDFGCLSLRLENQPLQTNPKSSEMTALNLVRVIENRVNNLVR